MKIQKINFKIVLAILTAGMLITGVSMVPVRAQESNDQEVAGKGITFPVVELDNCTDKKSCKAYCDLPDNFKACFAFAKKHNLIKKIESKSEQEVEKFAETMKRGGPGSCKSHEQCRTYCDNADHMEECVAFAEENKLMPPEEIEKAKKVAKAVKAGVKLPPGCKNKEQCEAYCQSSPENMEQCMEFAQKAGFLKPDEAERAQKMLELTRSGETPGGCKNKTECEAYCHTPDNMNECMAFGEKMGFKPPEGQVGMMQGRQGGALQMPPEIADCLRIALGEEDFAHMQKGGRPSAENEEMMRTCFENMRPPEAIDDENYEGRMMQPIPDEEDRFNFRGEIKSFNGEGEKKGFFQRIFKRPHSSRSSEDYPSIMEERQFLGDENEGVVEGELKDTYQNTYQKQYRDQYQNQHDKQYQEEFREENYEYYKTQIEKGVQPADTMNFDGVSKDVNQMKEEMMKRMQYSPEKIHYSPTSVEGMHKKDSYQEGMMPPRSGEMNMNPPYGGTIFPPFNPDGGAYTEPPPFPTSPPTSFFRQMVGFVFGAFQ